MKKYLAHLLCLLIICSPIRVKAENIMNIVYSDIIAYIDDRPIQSFNIDGKTFIFVEDLNKHGFDVEWREDIQALSIEYNPLKEVTAQYEPKIDVNKIGDIVGSATFKNISIRIDGKQLVNYGYIYNIRGKTALWLDDLAKYYSKEYTWSQKDRTLKLILSKDKAKTFDWNYNINWRDAYNDLNNIKYNPPDCKSTCQLYKVVNGDEYELQLEYVTGRKESTFDFSISSSEISVSFYQNYFEELGETMFSDCVNVNYNEREIENTQERKEEVSKKFRVLVNDEQIDGEFYRSQGNGHVDYSFKFDKEVALEDIQTVSIQLGI